MKLEIAKRRFISYAVPVSMATHLGRAIKDLMQQVSKKQADLARMTSMPNSHLSRILNGQQKYVSNENLQTISLALTNLLPESDRKQAQAVLLAAFLEDKRIGPGHELVAIHVANKPINKSSELPSVNLEPDVKDALHWILNEVSSRPEVSKFLVSWVSMMRGGGASAS